MLTYLVAEDDERVSCCCETLNHVNRFPGGDERNANIVSFHIGTTQPAETEKDLAVCTQFLLIVECEQGVSSRPLIQAGCQDPGWP